MTYKLIRTGVIIALVAGSAVACHYKAGSQYVSNDVIPGADSGTRRVSATTMRSDSTSIPMDSVAMRTADTTSMKPTGASKTHPTSMTRPAGSARSATASAPRIYTAADIAPQFPGGQHGLNDYINKNVNYPQQAIDDDVSGTVHVSFIVDKEGHVTRAKVMDAANVGDGLDQEALRVVKNMPAWTPGMVKGKKVRTRMELPINFQVQS